MDPQRDELEGLLTAGEVGRILRIHPKTVYHFVEDGRLPAVRLSRRCVRFRRQDIEALLRDRLVGAVEREAK